jgi:hypothetical protein
MVYDRCHHRFDGYHSSTPLNITIKRDNGSTGGEEYLPGVEGK